MVGRVDVNKIVPTAPAGTSDNRAASTAFVTSAIATAVPVPLPVSKGGTGDTGTAWTAYVPTIVSGTGTLTTASATGRSKTLGKTVFFEITGTITAAGTGASNIQMSLPFTASAFRFAGAGQEVVNTGKGVVWSAAVSGSVAVCTFAGDGSYPGASGNVLVIAGVYESA